MPYKLFFRLADTVGDGSGTKEATGDYSGNPTVFKVTAQPTEHLVIHRMLVNAEASSFAEAGNYGTGGPLSVGISLYVTDKTGTIQYYLTDEDFPVKTNAEWGHQCFDVAISTKDHPQGNEYLAVRWTFAKSGRPVELLPGWSLSVLLQDDLDLATAGLIQHSFLMQGYYRQPKIGSDAGHS